MLAKKPLTDRAIAAVKPAPPGKRRLLWDAVVPGLALRVTDTGSNRALVLVARYPGSRHPAPRSLGRSAQSPSPMLGTQHGSGWARSGRAIDPQAQSLARRGETFPAIANGYLTREANDHRSRGKTEATLTRLVFPTFGPRPIDTITRGDVVRLLDRSRMTMGR